MASEKSSEVLTRRGTLAMAERRGALGYASPAIGQRSSGRMTPPAGEAPGRTAKSRLDRAPPPSSPVTASPTSGADRIPAATSVMATTVPLLGHHARQGRRLSTRARAGIASST